jgi:dihydrofolate reductase
MKPILSLIAAIGPHNELGAGNRLLWHIPEDLKHFKAVTTGHTVIMGRRTFESLGKPLPNRTNLVLSRSQNGLSLELALASLEDESEVFIIGGAQIYAQTIDRADRLYITHIKAPLPEGGADAFFPIIDPDRWREAERADFMHGAVFPYPFSFVRYERF